MNKNFAREWEHFIQEKKVSLLDSEAREELAYLLENFVKDMREWFACGYLYEWADFFRVFPKEDRLKLFGRIASAEKEAKKYRYLNKVC